MNLAIYRIRKTKISKKTGQTIPAPGVGLRLSRALNAQVVTSQNPVPPLVPGTVVINYGRSIVPNWRDKLEQKGGRILNTPEAVSIAVDKLKTLKCLTEAGVSCLTYTTDKAEAQKWLTDGYPVIVRATTTGKMGKGVSLVSPGEELPDAPLYTLFYNKTHEFRVHVFNGQVIDFVQKKRMSKEKLEKFHLEAVNTVVRNHKRGWVFARKDIKDRVEIRELGLNAIKAVGLDFGAVDILARFSKVSGTLMGLYVCEVNSAPGMSDSNTFKAYTKAVDEFMGSLNQPVETELVTGDAVIASQNSAECVELEEGII